MSINRQMAKQIVVYINNGMLPIHKKEHGSDIYTTSWMNLKNIILSEKRQTQRLKLYDSF